MSEVRELAPIMVENASSVTSLQSVGSETRRIEIVDGLCGICSHILSNLDLFIEKGDDDLWSSHHNSVLELRRSAKNGCSLCALFVSDGNNAYSSIRYIPVKHSGCHEEDSETDPDTRKADYEIGAGDPERGSESNHGDTKVGDGGVGEVESLDIQSGRNNIESPYANQRTPEGLPFKLFQSENRPQGHLTWFMPDAASPFTSATIQLSPVLNSDEHSPEQHHNNPSPDELIFMAKKWVGDCNDRHDCFQSSHDYELPTRLLHIGHENLQLSLSANLPRDTRYATLSHCWGSGENLKLTQSTLQSFNNKIPQDELCKTFQDAIFITSKLGLEYLWIDSLCIIQDDEDDWRQESALMSTVYGNSYLNIAAAGASDGSQGCFFENEPMRINKLQIATIENGEKKFYACTPWRIYRHCVSSTPLASRAWALQERLLAPRTLHFSRAQLFWECNEGNLCESLPYQVPPDLLKSDWYLEKCDLSNFWKKIIFVYSGCQLTKPRDKLVALSGIIRKIQSERNDDCFAGLWRRNMESELLWHLDWPSPRSAVYVAPSWSWAAMNGVGTAFADGFYSPQVDHSQELYARVLNVSVDSCGNDRLGEIRGGSISLLCRTLVDVTWLGRVSSISRNAQHGLRREKMEIKGNRNNLEFEAWVFWDYEDSVEEVYMLPIRGSIESISGLMVVATGQEQGQYQRIGMFDSLSGRHASEGTQRLVEVLLNPEHSAGTDAFASFIDNSGYEKEHWVLNIV